MLFKEVVGQQEVKQKLTGLVGSGKIPHAMMLAGPEGNGALALSLALAQYIHCENKQESDSCGECPSCLKNQKFIHPDLHFTFPVITKKSGEKPISNDYIAEWRNALADNPYMNGNDWLQRIGAENQQGNITVRECHEIIRGMSLKTYESQFKIQIIWLAEYLKETGNTLLKVIEEPPVDTVFILVVENIEQILNTILSRTQIIKVNAIDDASMREALKQRFEMNDEAAKRIARIADGNLNAAISMADGHENANDLNLRKWLGYCYNLKLKPSETNTQNLFSWIDDASKWGRENQKIFIRYALFFLRECLALNVSGQSQKLEGEELKFAQGLASKLDAEQILTLSQVLNRIFYHIERNANPKILFTSNAFRIASVFKQEEVEID